MQYPEAQPPAGVSRVPHGPVRKALEPFAKSLYKRIDDLKSSQLTHDQMVSIANDIMKNVQHNVTVEEKTVNKTVVQKASVPQEVIDVLAVLTQIVSQAPVAPPIKLVDFRPHDQDEGEDIEYYGYAHPNGTWYIMENKVKLDRQRYFAGTEDYEKAWKKRGDHKYKIISEVFNEA